MADFHNTADHQKILIFRWLTIRNLIAALTFLSFGRRILFIEPVGILRHDRALEVLNRIGIKLVDFDYLEGMDFGRHLKTTALYTENIIDHVFTNEDFEYLTARASSLKISNRSFKALLFNAISDRTLTFSQAYGLAEYFRERGIVADIFQARGIMDVFLSRSNVTEVRNFYPSFFCWMIAWANETKFLPTVLYFVLNSISKILPDPREGRSVDAAYKKLESQARGKVIFFAHRGISYGNLFLKDQYYAQDPKSPLHPSNILHIEFSWRMPFSDKVLFSDEYDHYGLEHVFLDMHNRHNLGSSLGLLAAFLKKVKGPAALSRAIEMAVAFRQFENYHETLRPLHSARLVLAGYDILLPNASILALQSMGIKVVANQERFVQLYFGTFALAFDIYFAHGEVAKKQIHSNPNMAVNNVVVVGDPRADSIRKKSQAAARERKKKYANFEHLCLVLDYRTEPDRFFNSFYFWISPKNNALFYENVAALADAHPNCGFIIRGKNTVWRQVPAMSKIVARLESLDNVFVDDCFTEFGRVHMLAAMADIVVARHTSLCDQCLAIGTPVIIDETLLNGARLISALHDYAPYPMMVNGQTELLLRFKETLQAGTSMDPKLLEEMQREYYGIDVSDKRTATEKLQDEIIGLLESSGNESIDEVFSPSA